MTETEKAILKTLADFEIVKECMTSEEERFPDYCVFCEARTTCHNFIRYLKKERED